MASNTPTFPPFARVSFPVSSVVTGGELFTKILNEGKLQENVARRYFQQLVDGVEYCHRRGVCHRDLKVRRLDRGNLPWACVSG